MQMIKQITQVFLIYTLLVPLSSFYAKGAEYFVGEISSTDILAKFDNFAKHKNDINYDVVDLSVLKNATGNIQIKVFFGQWCHDSVREVPRLVTLFSKVNNTNINTWFYALDTHKSDPLSLSDTHNIKKTPTVIVYKNGVELGRILEFPVVNWVTDIGAILTGV